MKECKKLEINIFPLVTVLGCLFFYLYNSSCFVCFSQSLLSVINLKFQIKRFVFRFPAYFTWGGALSPLADIIDIEWALYFFFMFVLPLVLKMGNCF